MAPRIGRAPAAAIAVGVATLVALTSGCVETDVGPPRPLGAQELVLAYETSLDARWAEVAQLYPAAERPAAVEPQEVEEGLWRDTMVTCLRQAGFGMSDVGGAPAADAESLAVAEFSCSARYPFAGTLDGLLSRQEREALYSYYSRFLSPCLVLAGIEVRPPPDLEDFVSSSLAGPTWHPYFSSPGRVFVGQKYDELDRRCPLEPAWYR